ncbi:MAG: TIM barrel protein [Planctomycetes bacterium]|nr:TIM barrel protein [Planctomycetota bacterium]
MTNEQDSKLSRRNFIKTSSAMSIAAGAIAAGAPAHKALAAKKAKGSAVRNGRIKQSVCKWCFKKIDLDTFAAEAARIGLQSVELLDPKDWPTLKKHGLICAMVPSHGIKDGLNRIENHEMCLEKIRQSISDTSEAGFPNVICFSGNRAGMDDEEGLENCAIALKKVVGMAEKKKVTICMELLNSKRNHKDYMCDRTHWGAELVKRVGSDRFKLLYDIYHMQVQEGDVIATIKENADYIGHYHTAGVPGRRDLDESQELYYPAIINAIIDTGFTGYLGQEFIPKTDPIAALTEAVRICDV